MTDLKQIPGVGQNMEQHFIKLGFNSVESLRGQDPEIMFERDKELNDGKLDRCCLYCYRLAVYWAETKEAEREAERLKWWNWKD